MARGGFEVWFVPNKGHFVRAAFMNALCDWFKCLVRLQIFERDGIFAQKRFLPGLSA